MIVYVVIFATKVKSCPKSRRILDVVCPFPNIMDARPKECVAYPNFHSCLAASHVEMFS